MDRSASFYSQPSYVGGGFPVFSGSRRQRGGGIFGAIARAVLPMAKRIGTRALKGLARHGAALASDVLEDAAAGKNIIESVKTRGKQRMTQVTKQGMRSTASALKPSQSSRKRSRPLPKKKKLPAKKRRRQANF